MALCELTEQQWAELRAAWESGASISALAKKYKTSRNTITARARGQAWERTEQVTERMLSEQIPDAHTITGAMRSKVIDIASRRAIERPEVAASIGTVVAAMSDMAQALAATNEVSRLAAEYAKRMLEDGLAGKLHPGEKQGPADVFKAVMAGYSTFVSTTRDNAGKKSGDPSVGEAVDPRQTYTVERLVINPPAA